ncbi:MAG: o-succinylbenzoate--CoA ligase, partial [Mycobacteriales bacterium]
TGTNAGATRPFVAALRRALVGGPAVLPLPDSPAAADRVRDAVRPELGVPADAAVVLMTSSSTGQPKSVLLPARALLHSARATHDRLGGPGGWLLAMPAHYVAGIQVLVRSIDAGVPVTTVDRSGGFTAERFAAAAGAMPGGHRRYTALVPTQLDRLLRAGGAAVDALASLDAVLVGAAATPASLAERAGRAGVRIIRTYGSSETCGGCVYDGSPLAGVLVDTAGPVGRIRIRGPLLDLGYLRDPAATAAAFAAGWFGTDDVGQVLPDGRLDVLGRHDDMVVTGGVNVAPALVERAIAALPGVAAVCVVGIVDREWGRAVAAAIVAERPERGSGSPRPPTAAEIDSAVREAAGRAAVPKRVRFVDRLPMLASGKVDHRAVRRDLHGDPATSGWRKPPAGY